MIIFKKHEFNGDYIPNIKGYDRLQTETNPFKSIKYTDENEILGNIYNYIKKIEIEEIVCYQKFGIIMRNPINLEGIYSIDVKFNGDS